jgi:RNase adaptor protein for sRNA GlmZ degradation
VEGREVAGRSSALNALQDVFHVAIDVLPELLQAAA